MRTQMRNGAGRSMLTRVRCKRAARRAGIPTAPGGQFE